MKSRTEGGKGRGRLAGVHLRARPEACGHREHVLDDVCLTGVPGRSGGAQGDGEGLIPNGATGDSPDEMTRGFCFFKKLNLGSACASIIFLLNYFLLL